MAFRRRFARKRTRRPRLSRRSRRKVQLTRLPSTRTNRTGGSIVPFVRRYLDIDVTPNSTYTGLDVNTDVKMSSINGIDDISRVFRYYKINKVKVTFQIATNFAQTSMVDSAPSDQLMMIYFRRKQTPTDSLTGLTETQMLEKGDVKRKQFNSRGQVSFYFTPNTWQNLNAPSAPVNTRVRKVYKEWFEIPSTANASSAVIHAGITGTLLGVNGANLPEGYHIKSYYTIYGQFKLMH